MGQDRLEGADDFGTDEETLRVDLQDRGVDDHLWHIDCVQFIWRWLEEETPAFSRAGDHRGD